MTKILFIGHDSKGYVKDDFLVAVKGERLLGGTSDTINKGGYIVHVSMKELKRHKALVGQLLNNCFKEE